MATTAASRKLFLLIITAILWVAALACIMAGEQAQSGGATEATPPGGGLQPAGPPVQSLPTGVLQPGEPPVLPQPTAPSQPAVPEQRLLIVEHPLRIRTGDGDILRLSLEIDEEGRLTPTAQTSGNRILSEPVEIPNVYDTHQVYVEARLDLAGMQTSPEGVLREQLQPGRPATFLWSLRPTEVGDYQGTLWAHLVFAPRDGGLEERSVLSAQTIEIQAVNLLGLGGPAARLLGGAGALLGSFLGLDTLLPLFKKLRRK